MKKLFLLIISLLLLTSCNNLTQSTSSKTKTIESNTSTVSSSKETNKSSVTTTKKSDNTSIKTDSLKQKGKLVFSNGSSASEVEENIIEMTIGEDILIGFYVDGVLIEEGITWYHSTTDCADVSKYGCYCFILGLKEGEVTIVGETEEYEASCIVRISSNNGELVDYFKKNGTKISTPNNPYYYFFEFIYEDGINYIYHFTYYENTKEFEIYCKKETSGSNLTITTEATITWTWGAYDQAEFKCTETLKYKAEDITASTTVKFNNECITFYEYRQSIYVVDSYQYYVLERGWENITLNDCEEMWSAISAAHNYVLNFLKDKKINLKLFLKNYNFD